MRLARHLLITRLSRISSCFARLARRWRNGLVYRDSACAAVPFVKASGPCGGPDGTGWGRPGYLALAQHWAARPHGHRDAGPGGR
jgi:hypothetical protein